LVWQDDLNPLRALELFRAIPDQDCLLLDTNPFGGRPEKLILTNIIVPPGFSTPGPNRFLYTSPPQLAGVACGLRSHPRSALRLPAAVRFHEFCPGQWIQ
jgi:hypothetical protein